MSKLTLAFLNQPSSGPADPNRRDVLRCIGLSALAPGLLAACGGSDGPDIGTISDARSAIEAAIASTQTPSVSVALIDHERVIWAEAFGCIDKVTGARPGTDTLFNIGSCSKVIAAVAVMILVDRGRLELDAPLLRYLPDFRMASPEYAQVTVRMLIDHASGFPGDDQRNEGGQSPFLGYAAQVLQTLAHSRLKHLPGEMSVYCNDGFTLVEPLVAAVSGKSYVQFVNDEILTPLDMKQSRFALGPFPEGSYAPGFAGDVKLPQEYMNAYASGGLASTPTEMANLLMMFLNEGAFRGRRILTAASVREMGVNQSLVEPLRPIATDSYGLGWDGVQEAGFAAVGVRAWHKSGGTNIYHSQMVVLPDERLAVMITGTSGNYGALALCERILLNALVERGRIVRFPPPVVAAQTLVKVEPADSELARMTGLYAANFPGRVVEVRRNGNALDLSPLVDGTPGPATRLVLYSDGRFRSEADLTTSYWCVSCRGASYLAKEAPGTLGGGLPHALQAYPWMQKLEPKTRALAAWTDRGTLEGLMVNGSPDSAVIKAPCLPLLGTAPPALTAFGYVVSADGVPLDATSSPDVATMCLKLPFLFGRDLLDLEILDRAGEKLFRYGSFVFRPSKSVPRLALGASVIAIGAEGYAEWRELPSGSRLATTGATAWILYGAKFEWRSDGKGDAGVKIGADDAWLLVYGAPGASIAVSIA